MPLLEKKSINALQIFHDLYDEWPEAQLLCGEARFKEICEGLRFGDSSIVHRLKVVNGVAYREDVECAQLVVEKRNPIGGQYPFQIIFMRRVGRDHTTLSPSSFFQLLDAIEAPPSYLEVLTNNNGLFSSSAFNKTNGSPSDYYIYIKVPFGPFANGSLMLHHDIVGLRTTCVIEATQTQLLAERFFELFSSSYSVANSTSPHPLIPLALFVDHIRILNEDERADIDKSACHLESRSGVTLHNFGSRSRAKVSEYALLQKELHMQESLMAMAQHSFSFQTRMIAFAVQEAQRFSLSRRSELTPKVDQRQASYIESSLNLSGSMATWTLEQLQALDKRLRVQGKVIQSTISTTDTLTMIRLARDSRSDSSTMKAITVLTMVFLPATFVCSLFSMGFFDFENSRSGSDLKIASQFWIYFAITVPLTVIVLGMCAAWLRWSGRNSDEVDEVRLK